RRCAGRARRRWRPAPRSPPPAARRPASAGRWARRRPPARRPATCRHDRTPAMKLAFLRQLPGTLWSAVVMELFERLAYYGMALVLGIYFVKHLGVSSTRFGTIYGIFGAALYFLPVFAGALADRFGYKPALILAFAVLTGGYTLLGSVTTLPLICVAFALI